MEEKKALRTDQELILRMARRLMKKSNDAVKLAYLEGDHLAEQIDKLDLTLLCELKRNANGSVELKLVDRVKALAQLAQLMRDNSSEQRDPGGAEDFYRALENQAEGSHEG
jgi:hypothetical protein